MLSCRCIRLADPKLVGPLSRIGEKDVLKREVIRSGSIWICVELAGLKLAGPLSRICEKDFLVSKRGIKIAGLLSSLGVAGKSKWCCVLSGVREAILVIGTVKMGDTLQSLCIGP